MIPAGNAGRHACLYVYWANTAGSTYSAACSAAGQMPCCLQRGDYMQKQSTRREQYVEKGKVDRNFGRTDQDRADLCRRHERQICILSEGGFLPGTAREL